MNAMLRTSVLIVLTVIAIPGKAETQCIRQGNEEIILFDDAQKYCPPQIGPVDPKLGWKFALSDDRPGCWRSDDYFVYVALETKPTSLLLPGDIEPLSACKKFNDKRDDALLEFMLEVCADFDEDDKLASEYGHKALAMAERYGDGDPRLLQSIDCLAARTANLAEAEKLVERSIAIQQRYGPTAYAAMVSNLGAIGRIRMDQRRFDEAEKSYLEAIKLGRQHLGDDHLEVVVSTAALGKMYFDLGKFQQAEEHLLLALAGATKHKGAHWIMAQKLAIVSARIMAEVYRKQNKPDEEARYREIARRHREELRPAEKQDLIDQSTFADPS
jgi:tetratricopeptide (TPR) repeat protein